MMRWDPLILLVIVWRATGCDLGLPQVDLASPDAALNLLEAFEKFGFSYITGHKVEESVIKKAEEQTKLFFKLPTRVKRQVQADRNMFLKTTRGWTDIRQEQLDISPSGLPDLKEVLDVGYVNRTAGEPSLSRGKRGTFEYLYDVFTSWWYDDNETTEALKRRKRDIQRHYLGENKWPSASDGQLKNAIDSYAEKNAELAQTLLQLLSEGIVGSDDLFHEAFGDSALQVQRLTRYPATGDVTDRREGEIGSGVHTDYGGVTLLHADGPGLQVLRPNLTSSQVHSGTFSAELELPHSSEWLEVEGRPGTFIALAGEALQRLSHGRILAARHKVEAPPHLERHSLAFFLDPRPDAIIQPLPRLASTSRPRYTAKLAGHKGVIH